MGEYVRVVLDIGQAAATPPATLRGAADRRGQAGTDRLRRRRRGVTRV